MTFSNATWISYALLILFMYSPSLSFSLHKKWSFTLRIFSINVTKSVVLITFTEEILNGKLHSLWSVCRMSYSIWFFNFLKRISHEKSFFDLFSDEYLGVCQTFIKELSCEDSDQLLTVNYFLKKTCASFFGLKIWNGITIFFLHRNCFFHFLSIFFYQFYSQPNIIFW